MAHSSSPVIISKLPQVGTTIFTVMSRLAAEHGAINLSQGFPDFDCSPDLLRLVSKAMNDGHNQYAPMQGLLSLRETLCAKMNRAYNVNYHPETDITITAGGTQAIYSAISAFIREGDEVILFAPAYDCYQPAIELNGGVAVWSTLKQTDFSIDWPEVKKLINHRTRMIIINTPHNPSGTLLKKEDLEQLEKITNGTDILVLSDEVYEHLVFDGQEHNSVCKFPGLKERSILIYSFGKTFHVTGWKMGYALAPASLMAEFRKAHQFIVFAVNTPMQHGLNAYLQNEENYNSLSAFYQQKRDFFLDGIKGSRFSFRPSGGTYFQLLDYSAIADEKDTDFSIRLTKEKKLASIPISVFYHEPVNTKVLRFCFAKKEETLKRAIDIINSI
ncbi:MAG: methionine aminotransferase [Flavobacteriales bacterium]